MNPCRTDLMLLEFKRESATKDIQRSEEELQKKRAELENAGFQSKEEVDHYFVSFLPDFHWKNIQYKVIYNAM